MTLFITDKAAFTRSGYLAFAGIFALMIVAGSTFYYQIAEWNVSGAHFGPALVIAVLLTLLAVFIGFGTYMIQPNESAVLTLFGEYKGTDDKTGLRWANPFLSMKRVSRRLQTHHIESIKVNDASGNPIEIGAAVVWHVKDSAKALLEVDDYKTYVAMQSETALRKIASGHPYDHWQDVRDGSPRTEVVSLRDGGEEITRNLIEELRTRFIRAGIEVTDARITHLAYAPEIASAMLRRQQATAIIAARRTIVNGAVELVNEALIGLKDKNIEIDGERQAAMISNMLIVLVGDKDATPVINTGTLYG